MRTQIERRHLNQPDVPPTHHMDSSCPARNRTARVAMARASASSCVSSSVGMSAA